MEPLFHVLRRRRASTSTIDTETLENSVQTGVNQLLRGGWGEALKTILFALLLLVICLVIKAICSNCWTGD